MDASVTTYSAYESLPGAMAGVPSVVDDYHHRTTFSESRGAGGGVSDNFLDNRVSDEETYTDNTYLDILLGNTTTPSPYIGPSLLNVFTLLQSYTNNASKARCDNNNGIECECDSSWYELGTAYKKFHGYIALVVCLFGVIANILIMVVLTRKEMRTPVNLMLFALAMADLLIMIEYIPFALHMYLISNPPEVQFSLNWARFVFFHNHFTQILHTISIQLVSDSFSAFLFPKNIS